MRYSCAKDVDKLVRSCLRRDWIFRRGSKHGRLSPPMSKLFVTVPGTPGDDRALANLRRDIARLERVALERRPVARTQCRRENDRRARE